MQLGLEVFLQDSKRRKSLQKKRVALVCHPASVDRNLHHAFDLVHEKIGLSCAFGPQHGVQGEKQDNMIESDDFIHPRARIPIYSLYGRSRRPTPEMMANLDVMLFDLQDLGCRIYTFVTTLLYVMQACAEFQKKLIVLDRPNPIGNRVEGLRLEPGWESFVGAAPMPMRHGLTVGELALYYRDFFKLDFDLEIVKMRGYKAAQGWPSERVWVNPSPNAANLNMARSYPGTVLLEGTELSEGRGTTRPLELWGAPNLDIEKILTAVAKLDLRGKLSVRTGVVLRPCFFEPTFHKHKQSLCSGLMWHYDTDSYSHKLAKPYRLMALTFKALREVHPDLPLYRNFAYEYVEDRLAFDVINGGPTLREWIDDPRQKMVDLEQLLRRDEKSWEKEISGIRLY